MWMILNVWVASTHIAHTRKHACICTYVHEYAFISMYVCMYISECVCNKIYSFVIFYTFIFQKASKSTSACVCVYKCLQNKTKKLFYTFKAHFLLCRLLNGHFNKHTHSFVLHKNNTAKGVKILVQQSFFYLFAL